MDSLFDLLFGKTHSRRGDDPFFFHIIESVDDGDDRPGKRLHGFVHTQNVGVLFLAVGGNNACNVAIIDGVNPEESVIPKKSGKRIRRDGFCL